MRKIVLKSTFSGILLSLYCYCFGCTNFLFTRGATRDGSTMITYSADSHVLFGELYFRPARDYPAGAMMKIYEWDTGEYLGEIPQARHTFSVVGNMNEYQVAIGETTFGGREELRDTTAILDYGNLMYIALQRAKTARGAIKIMTSLVEKYGYYSEGESFSISDPKEVWIMEMIGKGPGNKGAVWVALRIPDGYVCAHANQARISTFPLNDTVNCLYAKDVISFAREKGYFDGKDEEFSFCDAYAPLNFAHARFCESRVWAMFNRINSNMAQYLDYAMGKNLENRMPLWIKPEHKVNLKEVMELMRDHFEGTAMDMTQDIGAGPFKCPYRWRPLVWEVDGKKYFNERATSTQQTGFSFIAQARSWLPNPIGGILWFGVDDTYSTVYIPVYCGVREVPESYAQGNGSIMEFTPGAAFWVFNLVSNFAYTRYNVIIKDVRKLQQKLENIFLKFQPRVDSIAQIKYENKPEKARIFLTRYSKQAGNNTVKAWKQLFVYLFTRYMDGNIKTKIPGKQNPKLEQPGYGKEWYRRIVNETGNKFEIQGEL